MLRTALLLAGSLVGGALGLALLPAGDAAAGQDPVVISLEGRSVPLSEIVALHERVQGPGRWAGESFARRKEFAELVGKKELIVRHAREYLNHELPERESMTRIRWFEKWVMHHYLPELQLRVEVPPDVTDSIRLELTSERHLQHVISANRSLIEDVLRRVRAGEEMEAIVGAHNPEGGDALIYSDVSWVTRPQIDPEIGAVLFDELETVGQVGGPVQSTYGWHAVRLAGIRQVPPDEVSPQALAMTEGSYRSGVVQKRIDGWVEQYALKILDENLGPVVRIFNAVHDSLNTMRAQGDTPDYRALKPPLHRLAPQERSLPLVMWSGGLMTIGDYIDLLWTLDLDFWPTTGDADRIRSHVDRGINRWMVGREARKDGFFDDPDLLAGLSRKEDELFAEAFYRDNLAVYRDSVTGEDVRAWWASNKDHYLSQDLVGYGFIRFPGDQRDLAFGAHEQLSAGAQWRSIAGDARKADKRVDFEARLDPTADGMYPQITTAAMQFAPEPDGTPTLSEPIEIGGEWVILMVYYRAHPNTLSFEEAAPFVKRDLQRRILDERLDATLEDLKQRYNLRINEAALRAS